MQRLLRLTRVLFLPVALVFLALAAYAARDSFAALLANGRDVSYAEIGLNFGHDSFLMEDAHYHGVVAAYLGNITT